MLHYLMLHRLDGGRPQRWWPWGHAGGVWLLVLLVGNGLVSAIGRAQLWQTAWATVILLVAATGVMLLLGMRRWFEIAKAGPATASIANYPLDRFGRAYL